FGIEHRFVAATDFLEDFRFEHKIDELLRPASLHDQLAAFVKDRIHLAIRRGEFGVWDFPKLVGMLFEVIFQSGSLVRSQFASIRTERLHNSCASVNLSAKLRKDEPRPKQLRLSHPKDRASPSLLVSAERA